MNIDSVLVKRHKIQNKLSMTFDKLRTGKLEFYWLLWNTRSLSKMVKKEKETRCWVAGL